MNDIKLKPCPFCGGRNLYYAEGRFYAVECVDCGGKVVGTYRTEEEAAEAWNTRFDPFTEQEIDFIKKAISMAIIDCETNPPKPSDEKINLMWSIKAKCDELLK